MKLLLDGGSMNRLVDWLITDSEKPGKKAKRGDRNGCGAAGEAIPAAPQAQSILSCSFVRSFVRSSWDLKAAGGG